MDDNKKTNLKMAAIEEKQWELELKQVTGSKQKGELIELRDWNKQLLEEHKVTLQNL